LPPLVQKPTSDPDVFIEASGSGFVRYWRRTDNRRWQVNGTCQRLGECLVGAVITLGNGSLYTIPDLDSLTSLQLSLGRKRLDAEEDVPVTPEFNSCCAARGFLTFVELAPGPFGG
jgi:hypothetical protein